MSRNAVPPVATPVPGRRIADSGRRATSASVVLRAVLEHGPVARSAIARLTGLSPAAVTGHCARLAKSGLIRETPGPSRSPRAGRPHVPVELDGSRFLVGGVHVASAHTTVALLDLRGRVVARRQRGHDGTQPDRVARRAAEGLDALLAEQAAGAALLSVGVASGGWVDRDAGTVVEHEPLGWRDVPLRELLAARTGRPVHLDGRSRALANAERLFGEARHSRSVLHLFVGDMVDAAFATDDRVHYGQRSQAGVVAHLPVVGGTQPCPCGRIGCLQAEVSERTLCRRAYEAGVVTAPDPALVVEAARRGDPTAVRLLVERARLTGRAVGLLFDLLNPDTVIVVERGVIQRADCLAALREEIAAYTSAAVDTARAVLPTSFPDAVLAMAGGAVALDVLYRDPLDLPAAAGEIGVRN